MTHMQTAANRHHSNSLPTCRVASSGLEGWIEGESTNRADLTSGNETKADRRARKGRREDEVEEMGQTHPSVSSTLQHIVQQLDVLTQVSYQ